MPLRRFTAAEVVLTQRLRLERPLLLMVLLGAAALSLAEGNAFYLLLTVAGVGVNFLAVNRRCEVYIPRLVVNLAVLAATVAFAFDFFGQREILLVLGHYLMLIQLCKLFERKRNRDYVQIMALSLVMVVASAVITTRVWFAAVLAVYLPVAFYVAMVLTVKAALDRQATARLSAERQPVDPHRLAWNVAAFPRRALRRQALAATVGAMLVAAAVFLLMPRGRAGLIAPVLESPGNGGHGGVTGFTGSISLRDTGRITEDPRPVLRVRATGELPSDGRLYLRGRVFNNYANGEWIAWRGGPSWWMGWAPTLRTMPEGRFLIQDVVMDRTLLPTLFAAQAPVVVEPVMGVTVTGSYPELRAEQVELGAEGPVRYTAWSWAQPMTSPQRQYLANIRGHTPPEATGDVPDKIRQLAMTWCRDLLREPPATAPANPLEAVAEPSGRTSGGGEAGRSGRGRDPLDLALARRIAQRLQDEYSYTLDMTGTDPDADPVVEFLFQRRRGHCEYFASAMTLLCRSLGVHARMAGGFLVTGVERAGGNYMVRARDAHAWCEVYTPSSDWVTFDPTPPGAVERGARPLWSLWDSFKFFWNTSIIGYNESERRRLFGAFLDFFEGGWRGLGRLLRSAGGSLGKLIFHGEVDAHLGTALGVLGATAGVAALALLSGISLRRRRRLGAASMPHPPRFYRRLLWLLRRRGLKPAPEQTAGEFLRSAQQRLNLPGEVVAELTDLIYRIRWGRYTPAPAVLRQAEDAVEQLAQTIKSRQR